MNISELAIFQNIFALTCKQQFELRPTFSQASLQLDQETGTITVTDNTYFDRETKESESE